MKLSKFTLVKLCLCVSFVLQPAVVIGGEVTSTNTVDFQYDDDALVKGALRIDGVSVIHFGNQPLKGDTIIANAVYTASEANQQGQYVPLHIETTDDRGTNAGWTLQVKQGREFTEQSTEPVLESSLSVLRGAEVTLSATESYDESLIPEFGKLKPSDLQQKLRVNPNFQTIIAAKSGEGIGSWGTYFGDIVEVPTTSDKVGLKKDEKPVENQKVTLLVPGQTAKKADVNYQGELIWVLVATPEI